jgi:mycothiol synthase
MAYSWEPLTDADTVEWAGLVNLLAEADDTGEFYSPEDLSEELRFPHVDASVDTVGVRDEAGTLVATGQLFHGEALVEGAASVYTSGGVHPAHRGHGIGWEVMRRLEERGRVGQHHFHPGAEVVIRADPGVQVAAARQLLADRGYTEARFFHEMEHDLAGVDAGEGLGDGIRAYRSPADDLPVLQAHTAAFGTHWRFAPRTTEEWRARVVASRSFRPAMSFVRDGAAGGIDGYVVCEEFTPGQLYVNLLGVIPGRRGQGVGSALLRSALTSAKAAGYERVSLSVDSDNATGAGHLYSATGFRQVRSTVSCLKTLPPVGSPAEQVK